MTNTRKRSNRGGGGAATEDPVLPAYDEGRVESVGEGRGQSKDEDPRTGQRPPDDADDGGQDPKLADQADRFVSSELVGDVDPKKTS